MSNIELAGGAVPDVEAFAREILAFQAYEIGVMEGQLAEWGHHPDDRSETAMAWMDQPVPVERDAGPGQRGRDATARPGRGPGRRRPVRPADAGSPPGRDPHGRLRGRRQASDPAVRALAARMARNQRIEVAELDAARERAGPGTLAARLRARRRSPSSTTRRPQRPAEHDGHYG